LISKARAEYHLHCYAGAGQSRNARDAVGRYTLGAANGVAKRYSPIANERQKEQPKKILLVFAPKLSVPIHQPYPTGRGMSKKVPQQLTKF